LEPVRKAEFSDGRWRLPETKKDGRSVKKRKPTKDGTAVLVP
jgi:hypothetical protein